MKTIALNLLAFVVVMAMVFLYNFQFDNYPGFTKMILFIIHYPTYVAIIFVVSLVAYHFYKKGGG